MNKLLVGAVAVVAVAAVGTGILVASNDDDEDAASATTTTTATGFDDTTITTSAASVLTTTTTAAQATTTTAARVTTTTAAGSATTTTKVVAACGSGKATVSFAAKDLVTDALSSTFTPQVTVDNQVSMPIEIDEVSIEVGYPNNETRVVRFTTAGTVIGPGTSAGFTSDKLTSAQRYSAVRFTRFTYFTEGKRATCLVTTP